MSYNPYQQTPTVPNPGQPNSTLALEKVKTPAVLLIVSGVISILGGLFGGGSMAFMYLGMQDQIIASQPQGQEMQLEELKLGMNILGWSGVCTAVFGTISGIVSIIGGTMMMKLRGWGVALIAAILSLVPCMQGCCLFSIPVGIYVIVVLCDSQVKPAFK